MKMSPMTDMTAVISNELPGPIPTSSISHLFLCKVTRDGLRGTSSKKLAVFYNNKSWQTGAWEPQGGICIELFYMVGELNSEVEEGL